MERKKIGLEQGGIRGKRVAFGQALNRHDTVVASARSQIRRFIFLTFIPPVVLLPGVHIVLSICLMLLFQAPNRITYVFDGYDPAEIDQLAIPSSAP